MNQGKFQKHFTFNAVSVLKKEIFIYSKPATSCFKYQVYLCGSEAITCLNALSGYRASNTMSHQTSLHPPLQAALPPSVWQHNLHPFGREL
jgi:hypothetical protein